MKNLVKSGVFFALALVLTLNSCDFEPPGRTIFIDDNPAGRNSALFTVTFDSAGADKPAQPGSMIMAAAGGNAMPATPPERVGFVFNGWYTQKNGGGQPLGAATPVTGSTTVYALWTPVPVSPASVTFDKNEGKYDASPREKKVTKGTAIDAIAEKEAAVLPQEPYRENYNFKGWNTRADGSGTVFDETTVVNGDITVYAQWEYDSALVRYTVVFDSNGGGVSAKPDKVVVTGAGGNAMPATPPEKTGHIFGGWYAGKDGSGDVFDASYKVTGNITVYAMWTLVPEYPVTITFDKNGGKYDASPREKKVTKGTAIDAIAEKAAAVLPQEPYRENYSFTGWNTQANGMGDFFEAGTVVYANITVYAQWKYDSAIVRYTVTFDSDRADKQATPTQVIVTAAGGNSMPASLPEKAGYIFNGWFTEQNGLGDSFGAVTPITSDTTVYAYWTPVPVYPVTITFDKNGGKYDASPREKKVTRGTAIAAIPEGAAAVLPQEPYRENYSFTGWNTQTDGWGDSFEAGTKVNADITVYALWDYEPESVRYTVTFDSDGADVKAKPDKVVVTGAGGNAMPATLPEKEGYIFGGWYTKKNGGGDAFGALYKVSENLTVYAKWILRNENSVGIVITFEPNGGVWNDGSAATILIPVTPTSGVPIPAQDLSKAGDYFTGWNTKADGAGDAFGAAYQVTEDITVYAQWNESPANPVTVTFNSNSGGDKAYNASPSVMAVTQGASVGTLPQPPFREGYTFIGWKDQAGVTFLAANSVSADLTVYAQWSYNPDFLKYTVTFNSEGADKEVSPRFVKVSDNGKNTMPATLPEKTGYIFAGWYTEPDGKGLPFSASFPVVRDMAVYAWWIPKPSEGSAVVSVNFNENGGTTTASPPTLTVKQGATVPSMPGNPTREGYSLKSWNLKADGSGDVFTSSYMVSVDTTVYAQWELNAYTISFDMKGATSAQISAQSVKHGGRVTKPANPTKTNFTFGDWYADSAAQSVKWDFTTLVTGAVTLYARWDYVQPITDFTRVQGYLSEQKTLGKGKNEYEAIPLGVQYDLGKMTDADSAWQKLLSELNTKGLYVKLDLSKATLNSMSGGEFNPAGNTELIRNGKGYITTLTLPTVAKKLTAGTSAAPSFGYFTVLTDITGSGVTDIGGYTFTGPYDEIQYHNYKLLTASFPAATTIGDSAFEYCVSLKAANYPQATTVEAYAFNYCNALTTLSFPKLTETGPYAFRYTAITALSSTNFPALKTIGQGSFSGCKNLKTVTLSTVTTVGTYAFYYCSLLDTVTLANVTTINNGVFASCRSLKTLSCQKLTSFGNYVFEGTGSTALTITLGTTAPTLGGSGSFLGCSSKTVTVKTTNTASYTTTWQNTFIGSSDITLKITN